MSIWDILSREAGQKRRRALDETLNEAFDYYLGPTGVPNRLRAAGLLNPISEMEGAALNAETVADPNATGRERFDAGVGMATNIAGVLAPAAAGRVAGASTSGAADVVDAFTGIGRMPGEAAMEGFVRRMNQRGPVPTMYSTPVGDLPELIKRAQERFEFLGLRTVDEGHDPLAASRVWDDGEPLEDVLDGVSATNATLPEALSMHGFAKPDYRLGYYPGDRTYLIGSDVASHGEDFGELVMKDPEVIDDIVLDRAIQLYLESQAKR